MDASYATIHVFAEQRRLYRENRLAYIVSSPECPQKHPIYSIDIDLGSAILCNESSNEQSNNIVMVKQVENKEQTESTEIIPMQEKWWILHFYREAGKDGAGVGICVSGPNHENHLCSYKFYFNFTNNVAEYEALILGIKC
jgi:hypothetical protein